ncbi:hypothetical protein Xind_03954 [Xenorhabdus indica]|nr:hypothetical protein [Xenorhabdus indica]
MAISTGSPLTLQVPVQLPSLLVDLLSTWSSFAFWGLSCEGVAVFVWPSILAPSATLTSSVSAFLSVLFAAVLTLLAAEANSVAPFLIMPVFPAGKPMNSITATSVIPASCARLLALAFQSFRLNSPLCFF